MTTRTFLLELVAVLLLVTAIGAFTLTVGMMLRSDYVSAALAALCGFALLRAGSDVVRVVGFALRSRR